MAMRDAQGIRCMWMRGGSSKGGYFLAEDLPDAPAARDALLLRIMGSPDPRQIDGMGGAAPVTSKVAIVSRSDRADADVDYLFLQVFVDAPRVSDAQPCGNLLAGVGPFAIERGLVAAEEGETVVRVFQRNIGTVATVRVATPGARVCYAGSAEIAGVPGTAAAIPVLMPVGPGRAPSLLPTGTPVTQIEGIPCTLIDAGMPAVLMRADAFGLAGDEAPERLEAEADLRAIVEAVRLQAGPLMGLGDVAEASVPKMCLLSPGADGALLTTRCFIPKDVHRALGVLCGVSIVAGTALEAGPAAELAPLPDGETQEVRLAHPTGTLPLRIERAGRRLMQAGSLRTARKLMDGVVFP